MDLRNVRGDSEAPDSRVTNANSEPLSPGNGIGVGASNSQDSSVSTWHSLGFERWLIV